MVLSNKIVNYRIVGDTCVFTCSEKILIDNNFASKLVRLKNIFQRTNQITKFVVIINWSLVSTKHLEVSKFTKHKSLEGIYSIAVVHYSKNTFKRFFYILCSVLVNAFIPVIETRGIGIKFFTNIKKSIYWSNGI